MTERSSQPIITHERHQIVSKEYLPNIPEIEQVAEKVPYITWGRILRKGSVEAIKRFGTEDRMRRGFFPGARAKYILDDLHRQAEPSTEWKIVFDHLVPIGNRLHLMANAKAHTDMWMRDCEYSFDFIDDPSLQDNILQTFEKKQRPNGQIPTALGILGSTPWHFADDESTLLYIIASACLIKRDRSFLNSQRSITLYRAHDFVNQHIYDGMYVTPRGDRRGWIDAFNFPESDVITQNQGLYAVALLALDSIDYAIPAERIKAATNIYQKLADRRGYLPFSAKFDEAIGPGSLDPEYQAITKFGINLLPNNTVSNTLENIPRSKHGLKVLATSPSGNYFDPRYFATTYQDGEGGNYQNGGVWLYWENNAFAVGELHGVLGSEENNYRSESVKKLEATNYAEFIRTGGEFEDRLVFVSPWHVWNIGISAQHRLVDQVCTSISKMKHI